jgi:hypothetical protein
MAEREAGTEIMKRLSEESLEIAMVFLLKQRKSLHYFSLRPKIQKPVARIDIKYSLKKKFSSGDPVPFKGHSRPQLLRLLIAI